MWITSHAFSEMRLLVEGAISFYEDDAGVLCRLAREADKWNANRALNDIGTALYELRRHITILNIASAFGEKEKTQENHHSCVIAILYSLFTLLTLCHHLGNLPGYFFSLLSQAVQDELWTVVCHEL